MWLNQQVCCICYTFLRRPDMSLCSYPTNGLVSTIAPDHHGCILQLHMTSSHVFIRRILSACMSITVSFYQHPCIIHLHPTISHVCNNCTLPFLTQVNRMFRSRRVLAIGGKHCDYEWTGSVFIHFYVVKKNSWRRKQQTGCFYNE